MGQKDPYAILNVPSDAELSQIEAAYWRLARRYNAALGVDPEAPRLLKDLNQAYRCLTTPQLRLELDQRLARVAPARREGAPKPRLLSAWLTGTSRSPKERMVPEAPVSRVEPASRAESSAPRPSSFDSPPDRRTQSGTLGGGRVSHEASTRPSLFQRLKRPWRRHQRIADKQRVLTRAERAAGLRDSTAATVARWRRGAGLPELPGSAPFRPGALQSPGPHPPTDSQP